MLSQQISWGENQGMRPIPTEDHVVARDAQTLEALRCQGAGQIYRPSEARCDQYHGPARALPCRAMGPCESSHGRLSCLPGPAAAIAYPICVAVSIFSESDQDPAAYH